jgi:hypothetical protein
MGGKKSEAQNMTQETARLQNQTMKELLDFSKARTVQMDALQKPAIDFFTAGAKGDKNTMNTALAPAFAGVTKSFDAAKNNVLDSVAPGAGREFVMGQIERDRANQTAALPGQFHLQSLDALAKFGSGEGAFGLQQLGAGMRSGEASVNSNAQIMQADAQRKASQMGLLGSLAGAGGMAVGMRR